MCFLPQDYKSPLNLGRTPWETVVSGLSGMFAVVSIPHLTAREPKP